jgi:hypothetical protein
MLVFLLKNLAFSTFPCTCVLALILHSLRNAEVMQGPQENHIKHAINKASDEGFSWRNIVPQQAIDKIIRRNDEEEKDGAVAEGAFQSGS